MLSTLSGSNWDVREFKRNPASTENFGNFSSCVFHHVKMSVTLESLIHRLVRLYQLKYPSNWINDEVSDEVRTLMLELLPKLMSQHGFPLIMI